MSSSDFDDGIPPLRLLGEAAGVLIYQSLYKEAVPQLHNL